MAHSALDSNGSVVVVVDVVDAGNVVVVNPSVVVVGVVTTSSSEQRQWMMPVLGPVNDNMLVRKAHQQGWCLSSHTSVAINW